MIDVKSLPKEDSDEPNNYLSDEPINLDSNQFAIHKVISEAIYSEIFRKHPSSNHRIALIGDWGTGKSTIISFLENQIYITQNTVCYFSYDLWSHSGDFLRRNFLKELYLCIDNKLGINQKNDQRWINLKSRIFSSSNTTLSIEKNDFSPFFSIVTLLCLSYATFSCILNAIGALPCCSDYLRQFIPLTTLLLTLIAVTHFYFICIKNDSIGSDFIDNIIHSLVSSATSKPDVKTTKVTQSDFLGSISYEQYLIELLELSKTFLGNSFKLIVVLDNLDRLSEQNINDAWNSIQIFANQMDRHSNKRIESWLILPISNKTIKSIDSDQDYIDGKLSKLFTIRYEILVPIRSEWKSSILDNISKAFPNAEPQTSQYLFSVLNSINLVSSSRRPRENKLLINEIVSLSRLHPKLSLESIAVYLWHKFNYENICNDKPKTFAEYIAIVINENTIFESLLTPPENSFKNEDLLMITFGLSNEKQVEEAMLFTLLFNDEWVKNLDINYQLSIMPAFFESLINVMNSDFSFEKYDNEKFITLINRIFIPELDVPDNESIRNNLAQIFLNYLANYNWSLIQNGGSAAGSILKRNLSSKSISISLEKVQIDLHGFDDEISPYKKLQLETQILEINSFVELLDCNVFDLKECIPVLFTTKAALFEFFSTIADLKICDNVLQLFNFPHDSDFSDRIQLGRMLIEKTPSTNNIKILKKIGRSSILNPIFPVNEKNFYPKLYKDYSINNKTELTTLFMELWIICNLNKLDVNNYLSENLTVSFDYMLDDNNPYHLASAIAYHIQPLLEVNREHSTLNLDDFDQELLEKAICFYLFGQEDFYIEEKTDPLNLRFESIFSPSITGEQPSEISNGCAEIILNKKELLQHAPIVNLYTWLKNKSIQEIEFFSENISKAFEPEQIADNQFNLKLSPIYNNYIDRNALDLEWIKKGVELVDEKIWKIELFLSDTASSITTLVASLHSSNIDLSNLENAFNSLAANSDDNSWCIYIKRLHEMGILFSLSEPTKRNISNRMFDLFDLHKWKISFAKLNDSLLKLNWINYLTEDQLYHVMLELIKSRTIRSSKWLYNALYQSNNIGNIKIAVKKYSKPLKENLKKVVNSDPKDLSHYNKLIYDLLFG